MNYFERYSVNNLIDKNFAGDTLLGLYYFIQRAMRKSYEVMHLSFEPFNSYFSIQGKADALTEKLLSSRALLNGNLDPKLSPFTRCGGTGQNTMMMLYYNLVTDR